MKNERGGEIRLVFLGAPGSGKGTQAVLLAKARGIAHISTGEMMRRAIAADGELGRKVKGYLDAGNLVPDELVVDIIRERLSEPDVRRGFILDGFPRTLPQARELTELLEQLKQPLTHVIELSVPDEVLLGRVRNRARDGSGRSDDNDEVMANRLRVYWEQTAPVGSYYAEQGLVRKVDGLGTVEEVHSRILAAVD